MEFSGYSHAQSDIKDAKKLTQIAEECEESETELNESGVKITESNIKRQVVKDIIEYLQKMVPDDEDIRKQSIKATKKYIKKNMHKHKH